ncbi:uncharacterized [Tachysurus ichikawai]
MACYGNPTVRSRPQHLEQRRYRGNYSCSSLQLFNISPEECINNDTLFNHDLTGKNEHADCGGLAPLELEEMEVDEIRLMQMAMMQKNKF